MRFAPNCTAYPRHRLGDPAHLTECVDPNQLDLLNQVDDTPNVVPMIGRKTKAFLEFHATNPHVYLRLRDMARDWRRRGKGPVGIVTFWETLRRDMSLEIEGDGQFLLNDHHKPYYARALMFFEPDLDGLFEIRASEADRWIASLQGEGGAA